MSRFTQARRVFVARSSTIPNGLFAVLAVLVTTALALLLHRFLPHASLSMLFLTGILLVSARRGFPAGLVASLLSFLAYNFLFTPPQYTLKVDNQGDVATLLFFLIMAAIGGNLAARIHREMLRRQESLDRISKMAEFARRMSSAADTGQVLRALADELSGMLSTPLSVLMPDARGELLPAIDNGGGAGLGAVAHAGWRQLTEPAWREGALYLPLIAGRGPVGLVVAQPAPARGEAIELAKSFCDQAAIALGRTLLATDLHEARLTSEREKLRSALLSSLSHDLRTPLASVIGSVSSLLEYGPSLSEGNRTELLVNALDEGRRLDRYIQNLLDMTRIGQGRLTLERGWNDIHDIVSGAAGRLGMVPGQPPLEVNIPPDFPLLWVHGALIEQAVVNLLDNATRFTPAGGRITVNVRQSGQRAEIEVIDEGPGIPVQERERVFEMFHTIADRHGPQGTGLGLAICRGMVAAHGGTVIAAEGPGGRGARMLISLDIVHPETEAARA